MGGGYLWVGEDNGILFAPTDRDAAPWKGIVLNDLAFVFPKQSCHEFLKRNYTALGVEKASHLIIRKSGVKACIR
jgi:hypothetical protein